MNNDIERRLSDWLERGTPQPVHLLRGEEITESSDSKLTFGISRRRKISVTTAVAVVATAAVITALVASSRDRKHVGAAAPTDAPTASSGRGCSPKCPNAPSPSGTIRLSLDGRVYSGLPGAVLTGRRPIQVKAGQNVAMSLSIESAANVRVADVWLTVNSYPSGFDSNHDRPIGRYYVVLHHPGTLHKAQKLRCNWRAASLFGAKTLDLTVSFVLGDFRMGSPISHFTVET